MRNDGYFIDGLQTRDEKRSRLNRVTQAPKQQAAERRMPTIGGASSRNSGTYTAQRRQVITQSGDPFARHRVPATTRSQDVSRVRTTSRIQNANQIQAASRAQSRVQLVQQRRQTQQRQQMQSRQQAQQWQSLQTRQLAQASSRAQYSQQIRSAQPMGVTRREQPVRRAAEKPADNWLDAMWNEKHGIDEQTERRTESVAERVLRKEPEEEGYRRKVLGVSDDELDLDFDTDELFGEQRRRRKELRHARKEKRKWHWGKKFALGAAAVILIAAVGFYFWGDSIISKMTGGNAGLFDLFRSAVLSDGTAKFKTGADGRTNILLFGTSGYDMQGNVGDGQHDGAQLTDSIMVLSANQETGDMALISVQRDLLVGTCTATGKINEVYYCANPYGDDEASGAKALQKAVSKVLGIELQYYVHVNWQALISLVDALGGITVTLDEDIADNWTGTYITAGEPTQLSGGKAMALARARHGTVGGDFSRTNSQQKILIGIKDRIKERGFSLTELLGVAGILGDNFRTDFSADEIAAGAKLATTADFGSIRQISLLDTEEGGLLTTGMVNGISYVLPVGGNYNYAGIKNYIESTLAKSEIQEVGKILVLNGSGRTGIAAAERDELVSAGFEVADIGDAPAGEYFEKVYLYAVGDKLETQAKLETYYNIEVSKEVPYGIDTTGIDFVVILGVGYDE